MKPSTTIRLRRSFGVLALIGVAGLVIGGCAAGETSTAEAASVSSGEASTPAANRGPQSKADAAVAGATTPGLRVGDKAPDAIVMGVDGSEIHLATLYKDGPIVLTFYRGGWCPFCNRALADWQDQMSSLKAAGGTFIALTPEKPSIAAKTREKAGGDYAVYSDGTHEAAKAFEVHFVVDDKTRVKYGEYGLDVGAANQSGTWELPAPATFVIDTKGTIRWVFADWDYKKRADPDEVIAAVRAVTGKR